jgi:hypothetical protein
MLSVIYLLQNNIILISLGLTLYIGIIQFSYDRLALLRYGTDILLHLF